MALAVLARYDLQVKRVSLLAHAYNTLFRIDTMDGNKYVLRISLPGGRSLAEIRSEMEWLAALRKDIKLEVPEPLLARDGSLVITADVQGVPHVRHCVIFSWVPGVGLYQRLSSENMYRLGVLSARLHDHAETFVPPEGFYLKMGNEVFSAGKVSALFSEAHKDLFSGEQHTILLRVAERARKATEHLYTDEDTLLVLHGDLHQGNVKVYRGKLYALDFDDSIRGYPVQDIAITLYYFHRYPNFEELSESFKHGYTSRRTWPEGYPHQIDTFSASRALSVLNFVVGSDNPIIQDAVPAYIEMETTYLEKYLKR
jgi:Ser/Thr protein kinase RdoA (MazF antagonist)